MVQVRKPNGKFGGKATDIKKSDVNNAIRLVMDETYNDVRVTVKKPVSVVVQSEVKHSLATPEFLVYAMLGITLASLAFLGSMYLVTRLHP